MKKIVVCIIEFRKILFCNVLFILPVPFTDISHQPLDGGLKVDDQIRPYGDPRHDLVDGVIEGKFVLIQIEEGKDTVLFKKVIGDDEVLKQIEVPELLLLPEAGGQKRELGRESVPLP